MPPAARLGQVQRLCAPRGAVGLGRGEMALLVGADLAEQLDVGARQKIKSEGGEIPFPKIRLYANVTFTYLDSRPGTDFNIGRHHDFVI